MKALRQLHLYLGCIFAPLIIYFCLSGTWQLLRLNDIPKNEPPSAVHSVLHELSKPHTTSTLPSSNPKTEASVAFTGIALLMGLGMIATASIGIALAVRYGRSPKLVWLCLGAGVTVPLILLFLH
jgi:hypothetical protein